MPIKYLYCHFTLIIRLVLFRQSEVRQENEMVSLFHQGLLEMRSAVRQMILKQEKF